MIVKSVSGIKLDLGESEDKLLSIAERELGCPPQYFRLLKKSLDARKKTDIKWIYSFECSAEKVAEKEEFVPVVEKAKIPDKPVIIVGSGPSGLFCALRLLKRGIKPILIERGKSVEDREKDCKIFVATKKLNEESNIQFGEGGAGTFSDGKLNTGTHSPLIKQVLRTFVSYGAPKEIEWLNKPHIGSDNLVKVVKNMRKAIIDGGGEVRFETKLVDIEVVQGKLKSVTISSGGSEEKIEPYALVTAIGHSARDTFKMLYDRGVMMKSKDFAVGVRIEHLQDEIGFSQYGSEYKRLPTADYKLTSHILDRSAFTFCMCPGGFVMPATSEEGGVVVNGMSNYARDGENANSALIVQVRKDDYGASSPLDGIEFQRRIERASYRAGGGEYRAPAQRVADFLSGKESSSLGRVLPTYPLGVEPCDLRACLPPLIVETLKTAIPDMDKRLRGFGGGDAVLTAPETRTSSPIRIERDEKMQSVTVSGLYPCGEGAGYAGGITSSAVDGIKVADALCDNL